MARMNNELVMMEKQMVAKSHMIADMEKAISKQKQVLKMVLLAELNNVVFP